MAGGSSESYRAAVIGVGAVKHAPGRSGGHRIGYTHGDMYRRGARTELAAAADIDRENLDAFVREFRTPEGYADHRELLARARPDIVSICTYVPLHRQMIEDCAQAGVKAVFCEKPFVSSPRDLRAVRELVASTNMKIMIAHVRRYRPACEHIRQLIRDGAIGTPILFAAGIDGWELSEWGSHWIDIFRYFLDEMPVRWVMGQARVRDQRGFGHAMEEHAVAWFEFDNGCRGFIDGGRDLNGGARMHLVGTDGTIRLIGENVLQIDTASSGRAVREFTDSISTGWPELWDRCREDLVQWIEGGPEPRLGLSFTGSSAELNLAAYLSVIRCDRVDLPLDDELDEWPVEVLARRSRGLQ